MAALKSRLKDAMVELLGMALVVAALPEVRRSVKSSKTRSSQCRVDCMVEIYTTYSDNNARVTERVLLDKHYDRPK